MSNTKRLVAIVLILALALSTLSGCFETKVVAISVLQGDAPEKVALGQFDMNSVTVTVTMSDRKTTKITLNTDMFYYDDYLLLCNTPGTHTFIIGYQDFTTTCTIEVIDITSLEVKEGTLKNEYDLNALKDTTGGILILHLADNTSIETDITDSMVTGFDSKTVGLKSLTIRYNGDVDYTCTYPYTVASFSGLEYQLNESQDGYIVSWDKTSRIDNLVIPMQYSELPIVAIKAGGFKDCGSLKEVYIPSSITEIGSSSSALGAFANCSLLTKVIAMGDVKVLGNNAFNGCSVLSTVELGDSIEYVGSYAFYGCTSLSTIILPPTVQTIGAHCFEGCTALTKIIVPTLTTIIGTNAFCQPQGVFLNVADKPAQWGDDWYGSCTTYYWLNQWSYVGTAPTPNN